MPRKKILWLCSWYPGKTDPFNGDFIQRHARAAGLYNDIHIIHVTGDISGTINETISETRKENHITENLVYFKKLATVWGRFAGHYKLLALYKAAIRKYILENGRPDLVHVQVPFKAGIAGLWMKKKYRIPYIVTEHWGIYNDVAAHHYAGRNKRFRRLTRRIFSQASGFISVSRFLGEGVNRLVVKKEYDIVPNAVNTSFFHYKERAPSSSFRFIHVSNMVALKNAEGILRAFKILSAKESRAELVMVGDTDPVIRDYARELGLPANKIFFRGEIPYSGVAREMQQADCFILFSHIENSPCVIGEALCCGLPVIATQVGGVPELVDETNAVLIEAGNEVQLAETMQQMINGYGKYDRAGIAGKASTLFSYEVIGKKINDIYTRFLE